MKVAIIGGGVTGIAEALYLAEKGHQVTLYEKQDLLGGLAAWFNIAGRDVECYYHFIMTCDRHYIDLLEHLGVAHRLNWVETTTTFYHGGAVYPFSEPIDLLKFKPLSLFDRFRLAAGLAYMTKFTREWGPFEDRLACEWLPRWTGRRAWDVIWKPMLDMKFGADTDKMGMAWLWARSNMVSQYRDKGETKERRAWLKGSSRTFVEAAERRMAELGVMVKKGVDVDRIEVRDGRAAGIVLDGEFEPFDRTVFSASSVALAKMLPPETVQDPYFKKIYEQRYYGVTCLVAALDRPLNEYFWTYVSDREIPFVGVVNYSKFTAWEGQDGHNVIYVPWYSETDQPPYSTANETIINTTFEGLRRMTAGSGRSGRFDRAWVKEVVVGRDPYAAVMCTGKYSERLVGLQTPIRDLIFANLSQIYPQDRGISVGIKLARYAVKAVETGEDVKMDFSPVTSAEEV